MNISRRKPQRPSPASEEDEAARVSVKLARAVRLAGVSRSATATLQRKLKARYNDLWFTNGDRNVFVTLGDANGFPVLTRQSWRFGESTVSIHSIRSEYVQEFLAQIQHSPQGQAVTKWLVSPTGFYKWGTNPLAFRIDVKALAAQCLKYALGLEPRHLVAAWQKKETMRIEIHR